MHEQTTISLTSLSLRGNYLKTSDVLKVSEGLISGNGKFAATIAADGRLCIYLKRKTGNEADLYHCVMMTGWPEGDYYGVLNSNGCFCINTGTSVEQSSQTVWTTNTVHGFESEYFMIMRDDGNLCIFGGKDPNNYREMQWCTGTANPVLAQTPPPKPQPEPVTLASTMDYPSRTSWNFPAGSTFAQQFRVQVSGTPKALCIGMGNNQNPYGAHLKFIRENETLFEREYGNLKQRSSDWTTVYDLDGFTTPLGQGEMITYELTLFNSAGFEPVFADLPDYPKANSPNGHVSMKFMLNGLSVVHEVEIGVSSHDPSGEKMLRTGAVGRFQIGQYLHGILETDLLAVEQDWIFSTPVITQWVQTQQTGRIVRRNPLYDFLTIPPKWYYPSTGWFYPNVNIRGTNRWGHRVQAHANHDGDEITGITGAVVEGGIGEITILNDLVWLGEPVVDGFTAQPGVRLTFTTTAPGNMASMGKIGTMQFFTGYREYTRTDGTIFTTSTNGEWYLDYDNESSNVLYMSELANDIDPGEPGSTYMSDSPCFPLLPVFNRVRLNERFRTYLVYKPYAPGSVAEERRWFPIGYVEWAWSLEISRNAETGLWPAHPDASTRSFPTAMPFIPDNSMPDWNFNNHDYLGRYYAAFPTSSTLIPFGVRPKWNIVVATQVEIHLDQPATTTIKTQIRSILHAKTSDHPHDNRKLLIWITLTAAQKALQVQGVVSVNEVPVAQRYSFNPEYIKRHMAVEVAPFSMFYDSPENYKYAESVSPRSLAMVADDLVASHRRRHPQSPITADIITPTTLYLTFPTDINEDTLREIASHQQVSKAYISEFRSDDPPPPIHDGPLF